MASGKESGVEFIKQEQLEDEVVRDNLEYEYSSFDNTPDMPFYGDAQSSHRSQPGEEYQSSSSEMLKMEHNGEGFEILHPWQIKELKRKDINEYAINCSSELAKFRYAKQLHAATVNRDKIEGQIAQVQADKDRIQVEWDREKFQANARINELRRQIQVANADHANNQHILHQPQDADGDLLQ